MCGCVRGKITELHVKSLNWNDTIAATQFEWSVNCMDVSSSLWQFCVVCTLRAASSLSDPSQFDSSLAYSKVDNARRKRCTTGLLIKRITNMMLYD